MKKITFITWLLQQVDRDTSINYVGHLAEIVRDSGDLPHGKSGIEIWRAWIEDSFKKSKDHENYEITKQTLEIAWKEYQDFMQGQGEG